MSDPVTITVRYSCRPCGLLKVSVQVPARGNENVIQWMERTLGPHLAEDHQRRSPDCHPETLSDIMIPLTGTDRVGGPALQ